MRFIAAVIALLLGTQFPSAQSQAPKLVVLLVIDQMRADYVDRFIKDWTGGLKRLATEGAWFVNTNYPYLTTTTCAGHSTISTGSYPRSHGIIQNQWWDRDRRKMMTCTEDPKTPGIGYSAVAPKGDSAWRQERQTFADVMRDKRRARVVTLAVKDRSAVMLAGHGGDAVTWISDPIESWMTSEAFGEGQVPAVQTFVDANSIKADFGKTWTLALPPSQYAEPDDAANEAPPAGWTRTFPHVLKGTANAPDGTYLAQWERSPFADAYVGRFAIALVDAFELGRRNTTDVLGVSFSTPDLVGHAFGPDSLEEHDIYIQLDRTIGELFDHLDKTVGRGQWTAALSADHGVTPIPERLVAAGQDAGRLSPNGLAAKIDEATRAVLGGDGPLVVVVNTNDIYFAPGVYDKLKASPKAMQSVIDALREQPGVGRVFRGEELRDLKAAVDPIQRAAAHRTFTDAAAIW